MILKRDQQKILRVQHNFRPVGANYLSDLVTKRPLRLFCELGKSVNLKIIKSKHYYVHSNSYSSMLNM